MHASRMKLNRVGCVTSAFCSAPNPSVQKFSDLFGFGCHFVVVFRVPEISHSFSGLLTRPHSQGCIPLPLCVIIQFSE
jgi:hypothetical protein